MKPRPRGVKGLASCRVDVRVVGEFERILCQLVDRVGDRHSLSVRERAVLRLTASGLHTKAVAAELDCSPKTVEEHWKRMLRKVPGRSRQLVVALVLAEAIVSINARSQASASSRIVSTGGAISSE
jgi:DNA-binding CsgD family transcriptional regulator